MTNLNTKAKGESKSRTGWWAAAVGVFGVFSPILPGSSNMAQAAAEASDVFFGFKALGWLWGNVLSFFGLSIGQIINGIMSLIFTTVSQFTAWAGWLLDLSVKHFVLNMAEQVEGIAAIDKLWQTFRDLGNIAFIGVLLYIAILTVLNMGNKYNTKRMLVSLVIVALFVNFSLFATKVVIDTSNVVALQFYNAVQVEDCGLDTECNLSHFFMDTLNISSVNSQVVIEEGDDFKMFLALLMGTAFMLIAAFVMGAMALLLIIRFVVLVLLMIASPLAFIAFALPGADNMGKQWVDKLLSQSFFAPAMLAMVYVTARLATGIHTEIGSEKTNLMAAIISNDSDNFSVVLVFIILIGLMLASIIVAKKIGAHGASKTIEWGQKARNWGQATVVGGMAGGAAWAGRQSVGRIAQEASESRDLKEAAAKGGVGGWAASRALNLSNRTAERSFDARNTKAMSSVSSSDVGRRKGGFREVIEEKKKKRENQREEIESLSGSEKAAGERAKLEKEKINKQQENLTKKINEEKTELNKAINKRNQLQNKLAEARQNGNVQLQQNILRQFRDLRNEISQKARVSNLSDLETRRDALSERERSVRGYQKRRDRELDAIVSVGKKRGEKFIETMLTQQELLDKIMANLEGYEPGTGLEQTQTRANREFAVENISDIKNKERNRRVSRILENL